MAAELLIVIPCLNEERTLEGLIRQFAAECPDALIVVADGGSTDRSCAIVHGLMGECPGLRLLANAQRIQSAGINQAVRTFGAGRTWLLRIDAHAHYPANYAAILLDAADRQQADSVVVPMVSVGARGFQKATATAQNSVLGTGGSPHRHVGVGRYVDHGHHALMRLSLFAQAGGYREDMTHNEDAEFDVRLRLAGGQIWLEPAAAIIYYPRSSAASLWRQYFDYGRGRARTLRLHRHRPKLRQTLPLLTLIALLLAPLALVHPIFAVPLCAWATLCLLAGMVIGHGAGGDWAYMSGLPAAIIHMSWACGFASGLITPLKAPKPSAIALAELSTGHADA